MVYVDMQKNKYGRMIMCHMLADSLQELHNMAERLGLTRKYYQHKSTPHYDICQSKRKLAIKFGAKEITMRETVPIIHKWRDKAPGICIICATRFGIHGGYRGLDMCGPCVTGESETLKEFTRTW